MTSVRLAVSNAIPMFIHEKCFYTEILKSERVAIGRVFNHLCFNRCKFSPVIR